MAASMEPPIQEQNKFMYACNNCEKYIDVRYHCTVCEDFDLCDKCFQKEGHGHRVEYIDFSLKDPALNPREPEWLSIECCDKYLIHATKCRSASCRAIGCRKMKKVMLHAKKCRRRALGQCRLCRRLIQYGIHHEMLCQENRCPVPFCTRVKNIRRSRDFLQRIEREELMKKRNYVNIRTL